jgi:hypothetical protein
LTMRRMERLTGDKGNLKPHPHRFGGPHARA